MSGQAGSSRRESAEPGAPGRGALQGAPLHGISEVILVVKDVGRSTAFYRDVVGLAEDDTRNAKFAWFWAGSPGKSQRIGITSGPLSYGASHCGGPQHFRSEERRVGKECRL